MKAKPLRGARIVLTRAPHQARELREALEDAGAAVLAMPLLAIAPPEEYGELDRALDQRGSFDGFLFTSANAVDGWFRRAEARQIPLAAPTGAWVLAVGPATSAALEAREWTPTLRATMPRGEGVIAALERQRMEGAKIVWPRGSLAGEAIRRALEQRGAQVTAVEAYRTLAPAAAALPEAEMIVLTSGSAAQHLAGALGPEYGAKLRKVALVALGPVTARAIADLGLAVAVEAASPTVAAVVEAVAHYWLAEQARRRPTS